MDDKKYILNKLRSIAAQAESLADDFEKGKLWDGDLERRISSITQEIKEIK